MLNKKGTEFGLPIYFLPTMLLFVLVIIIFGIIFFGIGITQSPDLVIKSEAFQDNSKITEIIRFQTEENIAIAELISLAREDQTNYQKLTKELKTILEKLQLPKEREAIWNLDIKIQNQQFLSIGSQLAGSENYYTQQIKVPLENKEIAVISLEMQCVKCTKEQLKEFA